MYMYKFCLFKIVVEDMKSLVQKLENRVTKLEGGSSAPAAQAPAPKKPAPADDDDDDDIDLFGSDDEVLLQNYTFNTVLFKIICN